jgi:hypothetical protein
LFDEGLALEPESRSLGKGKRKKRGIKMESRTKVVEEEGKISRAQMLRKRVASFSNGVAIGSESFVRGVASRYQEEMRRLKEPKTRQDSGGGGFYVMRE